MAEPWLFFYSNIPGSQGDRESGFLSVPLASDIPLSIPWSVWLLSFFHWKQFITARNRAIILLINNQLTRLTHPDVVNLPGENFVRHLSNAQGFCQNAVQVVMRDLFGCTGTAVSDAPAFPKGHHPSPGYLSCLLVIIHSAKLAPDSACHAGSPFCLCRGSGAVCSVSGFSFRCP